MDDKQFVDAIVDEMFGKNFERYKQSLSKPVNDDGDAYARARNALSLLSESQRCDVINFLKLVIADSASVVFGSLDGVCFPGDLKGDFVLSCDGREMQGDLQDIFIERAQAEGVYD